MTNKLICFVCHIINQLRCCWLTCTVNACHRRHAILRRSNVGIAVINKCTFIVLNF